MYSSNLTANIIDRLNENKSAFKTYGTYEKAVEVANKVAAEAVEAHTFNGKAPRTPDFFIIYVPTVQRFVISFGAVAFFRDIGGYVMWFAAKGHCQH